MHRFHSPCRLVLAALAAPLLLLGCTQPKDEEPVQNAPAPVEAKPVAKVLPQPDPALDREAVIIAALRAATATALGQDDSAAQAQLKGRRFEVRFRFGCSGNDSKATTGWTYDEKDGVLRARIRADVDGSGLEASNLFEDEYEGAVGFTLNRPWMLVDGCTNPEIETVPGGPTIALAQLFTSSDSRVQRPEERYEAVAQLTKDQLPTQGLNLVVTGRLRVLADGRAIHCAAREGPPACVISATIDRVSIEDPMRNTPLGSWGAS